MTACGGNGKQPAGAGSSSAGGNAKQPGAAGAISAGGGHTVGLRADGTAVAVGSNKDWNGDEGAFNGKYTGQCDVSSWTDLVAVSAGDVHTVGLRADGTAVATGLNDDGQCDVSGWSHLVAVSAGREHTVGLRADGTAVATGLNDDGQCDVSGWSHLVAVDAGGWHTVGLRADGTAVAAGSNMYGECDVSAWRDLIAVSAGDQNTVGLHADGTVVDEGAQSVNSDMDTVTGLIAVSTGGSDTAIGSSDPVGLRADGTAVAMTYDGPCDVSSWKLATEPLSTTAAASAPAAKGGAPWLVVAVLIALGIIAALGAVLVIRHRKATGVAPAAGSLVPDSRGPIGGTSQPGAVQVSGEKSRFCAGCGSPVGAGSTFCASCGAKVTR